MNGNSHYPLESVRTSGVKNDRVALPVPADPAAGHPISAQLP